MENRFYPKDASFQKLDCDVAFQNLTKRERLYAHYISRAAWEGQFITMFQTSPESPLIFIFLDKILRLKPSLAELETHLQETHAFTKEDFEALLIYATTFMANCGNYRGFGDSKFIPDVSIEKLTSVAKEVINPEENPFFIQHCINPMLDYSANVRLLGFPNNGITTYWSANCTEEDGKLVTEFLNFKNVEQWNSRVFKIREGDAKDVYEIRFASEQLSEEPDKTAERLIGHQEEFKGKLFRFTRGDYSDIMTRLIANLKLASENALNDVERLMILDYIEYFETGSIVAHKNGSRHWIKDRGPSVETYIGFIEAYRDPVKSRAEFEGFVAVVNRKVSEKLGELVNHAEAIITSSLPWPKEFEIDSYLRPDFTALDVITFSSSMVPSGINIPNYDDIRRNEGFKNVQLLNSINAYNAAAKICFLSDADASLLKKYQERAYEVQVGLHELLGHGSGKLFRVDAEGNLNFDKDKTINPLTGEPVGTFYKAGESFKSVFTSTSSAFEECRAECVGMYLCTREDILKIFNCEGQEAEDVLYVNWLMMVLLGLKGLETYNPAIEKWGQAHSQARFVILRVLLEEAKDLIDIQHVTNKEDGKPDLLISINRSAIKVTGRKAIGDFLLKLQVYKSTADIHNGGAMFMGYSQVKSSSPSGHDFEKIRDVIVDRKRPRPILVQSNTWLNESTNDVDLISYESSPEGFAKSWIDRHPQPEPLYKILKKLYNKDLKHFPVK